MNANWFIFLDFFMKLMILNFIAFIIAASSLQINFRSEIVLTEHGTDIISSIRSIDIETIRVTSEKKYQELETSFFDLAEPIASRLIESLAIIPFLYYLPTYSLIRVKEFFLLI